MTTTPNVIIQPDYLCAAVRLSDAAHRMYEAELAVHAARQSQVDPWVRAACDRLHEAILEHSAARDALSRMDEQLRPAC